MALSFIKKAFHIGDDTLAVFVPDPVLVQQQYQQTPDAGYWAKVWPASIALCRFLQEHPYWVTGKTVLELAAGLGLPGLYAARMARQVISTDREPQAAAYVQQSAAALQLDNLVATTLNWSDAAAVPSPDVLLLSDVNYEPAVFAELQQVLKTFLYRQIPVIISTPQRLVAKQFINSLLSYSSIQWSCTVSLNGADTENNVFVLEKRAPV